MAFIKYNSIENYYQEKRIWKTFKFFPELNDCKWVLEHKIDGSNIQFVFEPFQDVLVCSRNHPLDSNGSFMKVEIKDLFKKYEKEITSLKKYSEENNVSLNVYGELFSNSIQKRINYGKEPRVRFFDMKVNGEDVSSEYFHNFMKDLGINIVVDTFGVVDSFQEAIDFDTKVSSPLIENDDLVEGVVIKPWNVASSVYFKKKNEKFLETSKKKKVKNISFSEHVNNLKNEFNKYINKNRVLSVFSKYDEISSENEIGKYIKLVLEDAKQDFVKDGFSTKSLKKKEEKYVYNCSKEIVKYLREYL